jgi:DNA-directed RNA polymerase specialized sigma24 family protein
VAAGFARLPKGQRLLESYYQVDQSESQDGRWERQQLASSMGLTEDALRHRVHRALLRLQSELDR